MYSTSINFTCLFRWFIYFGQFFITGRQRKSKNSVFVSIRQICGKFFGAFFCPIAWFFTKSRIVGRCRSFWRILRNQIRQIRSCANFVNNQIPVGGSDPNRILIRKQRSDLNIFIVLKYVKFKFNSINFFIVFYFFTISYPISNIKVIVGNVVQKSRVEFFRVPKLNQRRFLQNQPNSIIFWRLQSKDSFEKRNWSSTNICRHRNFIVYVQCSLRSQLRFRNFHLANS